MSAIEYHKQPVTLDPTKDDIPADAPRAQGHTEELAAAVADADAEYTEQVKAEAKDAKDREEKGEPADVGPRDPGDHAKSGSSSSGDSKAKKS